MQIEARSSGSSNQARTGRTLNLEQAIKPALKNLVLKSSGFPARLAMLARWRRNRGETESIDAVMQVFLTPEQQKDSQYAKRMHRHIRRDMIRHLITPDEYFLYGFEELSSRGKRMFVGDIERSFLCAKLYNNPSGQIFMDKADTYRHFARYYKREVLAVREACDKEAFLSFAERHPSFIVKPNRASRGDGIYKASAHHAADAEAAFEKILENGDGVVEELIDQAPEMAAFHPESVNTVRYATFIDNGKITTVASFVKLGRAGSIVDNGGAGGLLAAIDPEIGIIVSPGRTEFGEEYLIHPDSGVQILGAAIPEWDALKKLACELASVLPEQKYVGWDLAYSNDGWVLVEGNSGGQFVGPQITLKRGVRPIIKQTFGKM